MQKQNHMHDPEFEKQIRQRMEELKFSPSETVWANLEKEITQNKRRRKPLLWFFLFLVIGLGGSFYFLINTGNDHKIADTKNPSAKNNSTKKELQSGTANGNVGSLNDQKNNNNKSGNTTSPVQEENNKIAVSKKKTNAVVGDEHHNRQVTQKNANELEEDFLAANTKIKNKKTSKQVPASDKNNPANDLIKGEIVADVLANDNNKQNDLDDAVKSTDTANLNKPLVVNKAADSILKTESTQDKSTPATNIAQNKKPEKKKSWEIGFTGGAGVSSVNENLFNTAVVSDPTVYASAYYLAAPPPIIPGSYKPSPIKPGFSFSAGIFVQKSINKKFSFSIGLNYHYSSTTINVGNKVDSVIRVNAANAVLTSYGYYRGSQYHSYTNQYHLLELPVFLSYQLNKSKKLPLYWEAGLGLAALISSDAVHFDKTTGAYFKDKALFNKTQLNAATAVMIGLYANKKLYFQVGPQVQYGLTNLLSPNAGGTQHLFFGGIKIVFIPNKK